MRARSLLLSCSTLLAAALVLAGCGEDPAEVLAATSAKTQAARSSKMAVQVDLDTPASAGGRQVRLNGEGAFDYPSRKGTLTMQVPTGVGGAVTSVDAVVIGDVVYERVPAAMGANLPRGKSWIKLDTAQLGANAAQSSASDPTQALRFLAGVTGKIDTVGGQTVRGVKTTHYRTTIDLAKAATAAGTGADTMNALIKQLGTSTVPADIWVDGDGRLRRLRYAVDLKGGQAQARIGVGFELFEFGTQVRATAPPADQVADAASLLGGG